MNYEGKVYLPWIETNSLLIQTTLGCTHNKCTFCNSHSSGYSKGGTPDISLVKERR